MLKEKEPRDKEWHRPEGWLSYEGKKKPEPYKVPDEKFQKLLAQEFGDEKVGNFSETLVKALRGFFDEATTIGAYHAGNFRETIDDAYEAGKDDAWEDHDWRIDKIFQSQIYEDAYHEGWTEAEQQAEWEAKRKVEKEAENKLTASAAYNEGLTRGVHMGEAKAPEK